MLWNALQAAEAIGIASDELGKGKYLREIAESAVCFKDAMVTT